MSWRTEAACRGTDTAVFFPEPGESLKEARRICSTCPVSDECLAAGLNEQIGVWGGQSARERKTLRRRPRPLPANDSIADPVVIAEAERHGVDPVAVAAFDRTPQVVVARHAVMRHLRTVHAWSYPRIGSYFGCHHTTVMHACRSLKAAA